MTTTLENDPLAPVLEKLNSPLIRAAEERASEPFRKSASDGIVIFGAGQLGRMIFESARRAGIPVRALTDNNPRLWGSQIDEVEVLPPDVAHSRFNGAATFVVGVFNPAKVRSQLQGMGCSSVASYPAFYWTYRNFITSLTGLERPARIMEQVADIQRGYEALTDAKSRREFAAQIWWRCTLDGSLLPAQSDGRYTYFDPDVYALTSEESVIDCGAFTGDTLRMFLAQAGGRFRFFRGLEPDPSNRRAFETYAASLSPEQRDRITVLPYAVGARNEQVRFQAGCGPASNVGAVGALDVECRRLDDIVNPEDSGVTMIKMDIEGAEPLAIEGATRLISRAKPVLAVCSYHYCEHLWQLPVLIKSIAPDYHIFLRRYAEDCWETVIYAIPPDRYGKSEA